MDNVSDDLESLAKIGTDDGSNLRFSRDNVANMEGGGTVERAETVQKVDQIEEVTVDRLGENSFHDSLESLVRA